MVFITEILDFSSSFDESPFHAEVHLIQCEKSRISTSLARRPVLNNKKAGNNQVPRLSKNNAAAC
ncbi:hypothetical protein CYJ67_06845 [Gardnerella vaginalis]|nr:hypothetical protein CYJ67_06845 [Gardnerella vaginalis]